ncbi:MAG: glycosyltransferase N-terminal domain-containing protein [Bacteroidota bacterium]|nr:glycosyltransferase N-terminal domain-containing protein [Bacteroidota bacterium]
MIIIYNIFISFYGFLIKLYSNINVKAGQWIKGRKDLFHKIKSELNENDRIVWFHCSSLGEFEQGRPLIEEFRKKYHEYKIVLTFFSPSGYEIRKNYKGADYIYYLPIDTKENAKQFIELINPEKVFFIKYEYWYHFLHELYLRKIPVYIISAKFRTEQHFFKFYGIWFRKMLHFITHFFVQDEESKDLLISIGILNVTVTGDTRFDRVKEVMDSNMDFNQIRNFKKNYPVFIAGSTWLKDEALIINYINESNNSLKYIIAPHEINPDRIDFLIKQIKKKAIKYSELGNENVEEFDVIIVDTIGILAYLYKYGDIAYIGGGFGKGIHNILEAAAFGLPLMFGYNYTRFKEAKDMVRLNGAFSVHTQEDFCKKLNDFTSDKQLLINTGKICKEYVANNVGATMKILENLN